MGSCAAPSAKGDDKFITTDYLQQCRRLWHRLNAGGVLGAVVGTGADGIAEVVGRKSRHHGVEVNDTRCV